MQNINSFKTMPKFLHKRMKVPVQLMLQNGNITELFNFCSYFLFVFLLKNKY